MCPKNKVIFGHGLLQFTLKETKMAGQHGPPIADVERGWGSYGCWDPVTEDESRVGGRGQWAGGRAATGRASDESRL